MTRIVIVDDQAINLKILTRFARSLGGDVEVLPFTDPGSALTCVERDGVELIVSDFVMPGMTGADFIRRCRDIGSIREVPIIVVTAYEDKEFRYRALEAGASDYLISPVDGQEFCKRARNLLTLFRQQQLLRERAALLESELAARVQQHAEDIRAREAHLRRVVDTVPALIRATDRDGRIVLANSYHAELFGPAAGEAPPAAMGTMFAADYVERHNALNAQVLASGSLLAGIEETVVNAAGEPRILWTTKAPMRRTDDAVDQIVTVSLDITDRKRVEHEVRESEARFRSLVEGSVLGIVIEQHGQPVFANGTFARIFGYASPDEILALPHLDALLASHDALRIERLKACGLWGEPPAEPRECEGRQRDGSLIWIEVLSQKVQWRGSPAFLMTAADISLRKSYEARLQRQAHFDALTGLPNRLLALDRLRRAVISAVRHQHRGGVLFIDLDQFKKVNDTWGHAIGDQLLKHAAERLQACVREEDTVARLGGDEFTVILPNIASATHTEPVVNKILHAFAQPFVLDRHECFVTASIGITVFPDDSDDPAILMQNADAAMYRAKEQGRNTFQYFTPALNERALRRMRIEGQLVHAVDRGELVVHFQPIVDVRCNALHGAEALVRWHSAELGFLEPDDFVPLAEDTGLIVGIGRHVLDAACREAARWHQLGFPHLSLSVNISSRQLRGRALVDAVAQALASYGLRAESLELEITEGSLMHDSAEAMETLKALSAMGVRLALDDFGTGFSCLSHLKDMPVDTVKIDKSFIHNVVADPGNATVVEAVLAMARRLGIRVTAEGVETADQLAFLAERGCELAQGFYFGEALTAERFLDWCGHQARTARQACA